ncbi:MAG: hypothetical protein K9M02_13990 [Thiohalocapsa sp.]|nr:hypothetical protein [Thiohalocapsa sp.]
MYNAPSLAEFAKSLEDIERDSWSPLVTLRPGDPTKPPLFLIHTTSGDVLGYINLVRHLDDRPIFGLQAYGLNLENAPHGSIAEMARCYLEVIASRFSDSPIYLGGWCYGGIVATEMAAQLERQGRPAAVLALIETWGQPAPSLTTKAQKVANLVAWGPRGWKAYAACKLGRCGDGASSGRGHLEELDFINRRFGSSQSQEQIVRMKELYRNNTDAADRYVMPQLDTRLDLLMIAEDSSPGQIPDRKYWWRGIAKDIHWHLFDGDHGSILKEPHVQSIASTMVGLMADADSRQPAATMGSNFEQMSS